MDVCNTGLVLGLGISSTVKITSKIGDQRVKNLIDFEPPSLTLAVSGDDEDHQSPAVKRERILIDEEDEEENGFMSTRKKLRLTKAQSALLEESFKQHSTLNPKQKQELARELKLRPRQVEVWFQNRRARTKLKQTEVDCEYLKKSCEKLREENKRLENEIQKLKSIKQEDASEPQSLYTAATLTICPSCEKIGKGQQPFNILISKPHFFTTTC